MWPVSASEVLLPNHLRRESSVRPLVPSHLSNAAALFWAMISLCLSKGASGFELHATCCSFCGPFTELVLSNLESFATLAFELPFVSHLLVAFFVRPPFLFFVLLLQSHFFCDLLLEDNP